MLATPVINLFSVGIYFGALRLTWTSPILLVDLVV